jgi:hypothetical protein
MKTVGLTEDDWSTVVNALSYTGVMLLSENALHVRDLIECQLTDTCVLCGSDIYQGWCVQMDCPNADPED